MATNAKQSDPNGLSGFSNISATCYMNAALQSLFHTPKFVAYLIHSESTILTDLEKNTQEVKKTITYKLREIAIQYWKVNCEIRPLQLRQAIIRELSYFSENIQHDTQDFLYQLIDNIHEATKTKLQLEYTEEETKLIEQLSDNKIQDMKKYYEIKAKQKWNETLNKSYSVINDIFTGMCMDTFECNNCHNLRYKFDTFNFLTLSVPENVDEKKTSYSLNELLTYYNQGETLCGNNQYNCEYCKSKQDAVKKSYIYQLPSVLIILIKKWQKHNGNIFKSNIKINYDHIFDPHPYITQYTQTNNYELYSVLRHSGGANGGHYYTYNKNAMNNLWYMHDDGNVYAVENNEPLDSNGYVLFYEKV